MNKYDQKMQQLHAYFHGGVESQRPPPLTEADLLHTEQELGHSLPSDYREFLRDYGGFVPDGYGVIPFLVPDAQGDRALLDGFFGVLPGNYYNLVTNFRDYWRRIPPDLLPVAEATGSNMICLGLTGERAGRIYFWFHEEEEMPPPDDPGWQPGYSNVTLVANSFDDFLNSIKRDEDEDE